MKKRRLADLYVVGVPLVVKDENGAPAVEVWLQKPGPVEHETCLRRANAARARMLMHRGDLDSEEYQAEYARAADLGDRDLLVGYLISKRLSEIRQTEEERLQAEEEWSKDDYVQGLSDAWEGDAESPGLKDEFARDPDHPEAKRVFEEMRRFTRAIDKIMEGEEAALRRDYEDRSMSEIVEMVTDQMLESKADAIWVRELTRSELFYAVREPDDHKKRYFDTRDDFDLLAPEVVGQIAEAYRGLTVDPLEGKDSAETGASSSSSEPPATEGEAQVSGPLVAVQ